MKAVVLAVCLASFCMNSCAQAAANPPTSQPAGYANYTIMLVSPVPGAGAVVLMHNPKNELEFVNVKDVKQALSNGYAPVRAAELAQLIGSLRDENARLANENMRLKDLQVKQDAMVGGTPVTTPPAPSQAEIEVQQKAQAEAEREARRQQLIQTWLMLQPRTQNLNVTVSDCTRLPALCAGR